MEQLGILFGLMAGFCASMSYLFSRHFQSDSRRSSKQLMGLSNAWMAGVSILIFPFVYMAPQSSWGNIMLSLIGVVGGYGGGIFLLFGLLNRATSSSVTPILGLKILVLAMFTILAGGEFSITQWGAVFLVICASMLLKDSREGLSWFEIGWAFATCFSYAISDFSIQILIRQIDPEQSLQASLMAASLTYIVASIFVFMNWQRVMTSKWDDWKWASGVALGWYSHMIFLYMAIAYIGTVYSVILQSTRSLWAVLFGVVMMRLGYVAIEGKIRWAMRLRQLMAALLTMGAIALYQNHWN